MATTLRPEALEIRLNSEDDARAAVQNFIPIQREAEKRGYSRIVFVVEKSLSQPIQAIMGTFFRKVKTGYVYIEAPATREFFPLPHLKTTIPVAGPSPVNSVPVNIEQEAPDPNAKRKEALKKAREAKKAKAEPTAQAA